MKLLNRGNGTQEELQRQQQTQQEHSGNLQAGTEVPEVADMDFVDRVLDSNLQTGTVDMLANLLTQDWLLGKLNEAEVHEARWLARTISKEVIAMHPSSESIWTGDTRRYASDDPKQHLEPLNAAQKAEIFQLIQAFTVRVTRSEEGFQLEIFRKVIRKSEREETGEGDEGGWL